MSLMVDCSRCLSLVTCRVGRRNNPGWEMLDAASRKPPARVRGYMALRYALQITSFWLTPCFHVVFGPTLPGTTMTKVRPLCPEM